MFLTDQKRIVIKKYRSLATIHAPNAAFTHQIEISGSERLLAISGQVGKKTDGTIPDDLALQMKIALENLELNLNAAGMDISDLVKVTFFQVGEMDTIEWGKILGKFFKGYNPCMMLLYVNALVSPSIKVEIDTWASS